jgi:drug/metabolite transporter (DMT)-like permease
MTAGQSLAAWALQLGPLSAVEPVLVGFLLVAFVFSGGLSHRPPSWEEVVGPVVLAAALAVFLAIADPRAHNAAQPGWVDTAVAPAASAAVAAVLAAASMRLGRRRSMVVESALLAAAAGVMYALQDAATRGAIVATTHRSLLHLMATLWPWVVLGAATAGVLLSQAAFRAERLDYALPPTAAAQPVAGIVLGVTLLSDRLSTTGLAVFGEVICLIAMLAGVLLIGRSPRFTS